MTTARTQAKALILADALGQRAGLFQPQPLDTLLADAASELQCLHVENENLRAERDDADRRAGRAERRMAALNDAVRGHDAAFRRMKAQWGVHENVSFDVVWQQALDAKANAQPAREPLTDGEIERLHADLQARKLAAQEALYQSRIGMQCGMCADGRYQASSNGYSKFHRCDKCTHVPFWREDGKEFTAHGITKDKP
ncbi:hypothetical protein [Comamonas antarctica]|uniref:hypothetical protein n=1 Tax=Comamonas antarctica TaxID=2743470 RepID=UPI0028E71F15|nr:hypothetical protein [Comamonas antarctica]